MMPQWWRAKKALIGEIPDTGRGKLMNMKHAFVGLLAAGCVIGAAVLVPS
jgi:hypothetical protein